MQNPLANFIGVFSLVRDDRGFQVNRHDIMSPIPPSWNGGYVRTGALISKYRHRPEKNLYRSTSTLDAIKRPLKIILHLCHKQNRQQFSGRDLLRHAASSVDRLTDYNDFYSILAHPSRRCNVGYLCVGRSYQNRGETLLV